MWSKIKTFFTWQWTKRLVYWVIMSAGTMSEMAFLVASLWMTINASVHPFMLIFMSEQFSRHLSELATMAYVALPECILALAIVTTLGHWRTWRQQHARTAGYWLLAFGVPTAMFLILSMITLGCSVLSVTFQLPPVLVVIRALAAYVYALAAILYVFVGREQEADRLAAKDQLIAQIRKHCAGLLRSVRNQKSQEIAQLRQEITRINDLLTSKNDELISLKDVLARSENQQTELLRSLHKSDNSALEVYGQAVIDWINSGDKSVFISEIISYTGHRKAVIDKAISRGLLVKTPRNAERITTDSLANWLRNTPAPERKTGEIEPVLHLVNG